MQAGLGREGFPTATRIALPPRDADWCFVVRKNNPQKPNDIVTRFMTRRLFGALGATALAALVLATLLPTGWVPRTGLGWGKEHFLMYFATTTILCIASRRPFVVAVSLIVCSVFLEALQGLTPDRVPDFIAALAGTAGVISAATLVMLWKSANETLPSTMDR